MTHPLAHLNPDCMVIEDLIPLARNLRRLAHYCTLRHAAMRCRIVGDIPGAQGLERVSEELYEKLPQEWRW
jgi:hypothetical protein